MRGYWWSRTGTRCWWPGSTTTPVQRWHIADPAHPERHAHRGRLPGRRHPQRAGRRCGSSRWTAPRTPVRWDADATSTWSTAVWDEPGAAHRRAAAGPAGAAGAAGRPGHRGDLAAARADRPGLGGHRARGARAHRGGRAGHRGRRRRARAGWSSTGSRSRRRRCRCARVLDVDGDTVLFSGERRPRCSIGLWTSWAAAGGSSSPHADGPACTPAGCAAARWSSPARTWTPTAPPRPCARAAAADTHHRLATPKPPGLRPADHPARGGRAGAAHRAAAAVRARARAPGCRC